jgi:hypothetical protein
MADILDKILSLNWEILNRFNIVADSSTFSEAAVRVKTSVSALFHQIEQLEKDLGCPLFERVNRNRSINLTKEGLQIKRATQHVSSFIRLPLAKQAEIGKGKLEILRVLTTEELALTFLYDLFNRYIAENPGIQFQLITQSEAYFTEFNEIVIRSDYLEKRAINGVTYKNDSNSPRGGALVIRPDKPNHWAMALSTQQPIFKILYSMRDSFEVVELIPEGSEMCDNFPEVNGQRFDIYAAYQRNGTSESLVPHFISFIAKALSG